ncbi:hypothetical protein MTQ01_02055 [Streptomyces sp. XM4193]|uniref:hypothetical protein n=1 Tax=Streptomyces sp. XM4193 TaxID=2929782 RepID=UPI001FFBB7AC|nr:hypothetical protein [Streptomyces sp. XM4193]MCK1794825.1 hypothetical protein [Streptomyces sp. XM4193]
MRNFRMAAVAAVTAMAVTALGACSSDSGSDDAKGGSSSDSASSGKGDGGDRGKERPDDEVGNKHGEGESPVSNKRAEELLLGVFFAEGPVADELGLKLTPEGVTKAEYSSAARATVAHARKTDPKALDKVAADLTSGDVITVRKAVETGSRHMRTAVQSGDVEPVGDDISPRCGVGPVCVVAAVALSVAAAQNSVGVTTVAVATQAIVWKTGLWASQAPNTTSDLEVEQGVKELSKALAA